jgi:hypothetical protein
MTSIKFLHVLAPQGNFFKERIQAQHINLGIASPPLEWLYNMNSSSVHNINT